MPIIHGVNSYRLDRLSIGTGLRRNGTAEAIRTPSFPPEVDVVIVGGGIIGLATALSLARRGVSTALFEKGRLGGEQSTRNWGWCRQLGRDARELPLAEKSLRLWRTMERHIGGPSAFRRCGIIYLAHTTEQAERYAAYLDAHESHSSKARLLTGAEIEQVLPDVRTPFFSALFMPGDGRADPDLAVSQLAAAAVRNGADIFAGCAVRRVETTAGRVSAVVTEHGRIRCSSLIVAAGAWSSIFCRSSGLTLPQIKVVSSVLATEPVSAAPSACVFGDGFAFGRQRDGSYIIGHGGSAELPLGPDVIRFAGHFVGSLCKEWRFVRNYVRVRLNGTALRDWRDAPTWRLNGITAFERRRVLDPPPARAALDQALRRLRQAFPPFRHVRVSRRWAGAMDVTPDALPVISTAPQLPGLVIGTGFSGHGFGLAPAVGEALADLATGRRPDVDLSPFRLSRFFDAVPPLPGVRF